MLITKAIIVQLLSTHLSDLQFQHKIILTLNLNDSGDDTGTDEEMLDDIEGTIARQKNIIIVRSAGNGFKNSSDVLQDLYNQMCSGCKNSRICR